MDNVVLLCLCSIGLWVIICVLRSYQRNNDWLSLALTSIGDAVLTADKRGIIIRFNGSAQKLTGWSLKDAIGKQASDIVHFLDHDTREAVASPVGGTLASGSVGKLQGNLLLLTRDKREIPVECVAAPIAGRAGKVKGVVLVFRDISQRYFTQQRLSESEERLRVVTNEARIGLVMINRDRRYIYANSFYLQMIDSSDHYVLGKRVQDVMPVLYEQIKPNLDRAFAGERVRYEVSGMHRKELGLNRRYSVTYEPQMRQSLVLNVVIVILDVTEITAVG